MKCPQCHEELSDESQFCRFCGAKIMICSYCGHGIPADSVFCQYCGNSQGEDEKRDNRIPTDNRAIKTPESIQQGPANVAETRHIKRIIIPVVVAAILVIAMLTVVLFPLIRKNKNNSNLGDTPPQNTPVETSLIMDKPDVSELAKSVLYLEIYDDKDELSGSASGFLVGDEKTLVTNYHVIEDAYYLVAQTPNGAENVRISSILAYDETADLAIVRCDGSISVPLLSLGNSETVKQGDTVYAIGYPLGISNTVSDGVVGSAYTDSDGIRKIQITAPISPGSSGGAILDENGLVIAVAQGSYSKGQNLNVGIAVSELERLLDETENASPLAMDAFYLEMHAYGNNAFNLLGGPSVVTTGNSCEVFYTYHSGDILKHTNENPIDRWIMYPDSGLIKGNCLNFYSGKLYFVEEKTQDICCFDIHTLTYSFLGLNTNKEYTVKTMLIAENKAFFIRESKSGTYELCIANIKEKYMIDRIAIRGCELSYFDDLLFAVLEENEFIAINMDTLESFVYPISKRRAYKGCPQIIGTDQQGNLYYLCYKSDEDKYPDWTVSVGIYYLDHNNHNNQIYTELNDYYIDNIYARAYGISFRVLEDKVLLFMPGIGIKRIEQNGSMKDFYSAQEMFDLIGQVNYIPELKRIFFTGELAPDDNTISTDTWENLGKWAFEATE